MWQFRMMMWQNSILVVTFGNSNSSNSGNGWLERVAGINGNDNGSTARKGSMATAMEWLSSRREVW